MRLADEVPEISVQLAHGKGYLGSLGVYHELHCLVRPAVHRSLTSFDLTFQQRRIKLWLHRDLYYPTINQTEAEYEVGHLGTSRC